MSSNTQQYARPARLRVTGADQLNRLASSFFLPSIEYIGLSRCAQPKKCQTSCGGVFVNGWKISEKKEFEELP
jgi:hypothetical protein